MAEMECVSVGQTNPDIAGPGMIYAFVVQGALSVVLSLVSLTAELLHRRRDPRPDDATRWSWNDVMICTNAVLSKISETQILTGISLLIAALAQQDKLSLYHLHIVYDSVNMTGVSACAALANLTRPPGFRVSVGPRTYLLVFAGLYLAYCVVLGLRLDAWDPTIPGRCYNTSGVAVAGASHPRADIVYLSVTAVYMFFSVALCWLCGEEQPLPLPNLLLSRAGPGKEEPAEGGPWTRLRTRLDERARREPDSVLPRVMASCARWAWASHAPHVSMLSVLCGEDDASSRANLKNMLLSVALCQFPVHAYMIFVLRIGNEALLRGASESEWGFGQIVAVMLMVSAVVQSVGIVTDYSADVKARTPDQIEMVSSDRRDDISLETSKYAGSFGRLGTGNSLLRPVTGERDVESTSCHGRTSGAAGQR